MTETDKEYRIQPGLVALGALSGVLTGFAALAVAGLVAGAVRPQAGPVVAVGGTAIDRTPATVKDWAIRQFGTDDKLVLPLGILTARALFVLLPGMVAPRFRRSGRAGSMQFGAIGAPADTPEPPSASPPP
ncbi:hypothetical protein [Streptomyces sp. Y7]|uniref:hypothetical protein n=1 Tax=Streptomyces sp. Y7 TaxID=3342392 RepID=UPI0037126C28